MVPVTLALIAGIVIGDREPASLALLFVLSFGTGVAAMLWHFPPGRQVLLLLLLLLTGWTNLAARRAVVSPVDLRTLISADAEIVRLRGRILEPPALRVSERDGEEFWRTLVTVEASALERQGVWEPAAGRVAVTTLGEALSGLVLGERIEVDGVLRRPPRPVAPGLFDYRTHLARRGVHFQLIAEGADAWTRESTNASPGVAERFQGWARATLARGLPEEDEPVRLLWAMCLGWRTALTDEVSEPFMRSGTMHLFAISGLHVAMIAGILVSLLRMAQLPRAWCGLVAIPLLWFYTAATGWQSSAIRSTLMASVVIAGWSLKRPSELVNSLAAAAFIILVWEPQQLFQASFQLSFAVVFSIALLLPHFERVRAQWFQPDPLLPPELRPRWQRWLDTPVRFLTASFATSLAAWLGSLPLVAHYFHLFTPVSLLANLLVVPLSGLALMSCFGSLVFGAWLPWVSGLFNHSAWLWMSWMRGLSHWCADLPGAWFPVPSPSPMAFVLYYGVLASVVTGVAFRRVAWKWLAPVLVVPLVILAADWFRERETITLHVLGLRGGEALVLDAPGRRNDWLIDCATASDFDFAVKPFLQQLGHKRLPHLILTHGDMRHVEGFARADEAFQPRQVYTSGLRFRSPAYRQAIGQLEQTPNRQRVVHRGDWIGPWEVLHPAAGDRYSQADDGALVLRGEFHGTSVLLLSDLGREGQRALLASGQDLRADLVIAGVPAQGEPLRNELLEAIQPRQIVISAAEMPAGEKPSTALRERLKACGVPVIYTLDEGTVTLRFKPAGKEVGMSHRGLGNSLSMAAVGRLDCSDRDDVQGVQGVNRAFLIHHRNFIPGNKDELRMGNTILAAIGRANQKRLEPSCQAAADSFDIHACSSSPRSRFRQPTSSFIGWIPSSTRYCGRPERSGTVTVFTSMPRLW
jgi:competence protein ComEC